MKQPEPADEVLAGEGVGEGWGCLRVEVSTTIVLKQLIPCWVILHVDSHLHWRSPEAVCQLLTRRIWHYMYAWRERRSTEHDGLELSSGLTKIN